MSINTTQKGFAPILIILILAAVLLGGYFVYQKSTNKPTNSPQPSPLSTKAPAKVEDPTANWYIYTNKKFRYSLKYPPDWLINLGVVGSYGDDSRLETAYTVVLDPPNQLENSPSIQVSIFKSIYSTLEELSRDASDGKIGEKSGEYVLVYSMEKSKLGNLEALRYISQDPRLENGRFIQVITIKNGYDYYLNLMYLEDQLQNVLPIFNQILSTFKFTQ